MPNKRPGDFARARRLKRGTVWIESLFDFTGLTIASKGTRQEARPLKRHSAGGNLWPCCLDCCQTLQTREPIQTPRDVAPRFGRCRYRVAFRRRVVYRVVAWLAILSPRCNARQARERDRLGAGPRFASLEFVGTENSAFCFPNFAIVAARRGSTIRNSVKFPGSVSTSIESACCLIRATGADFAQKTGSHPKAEHASPQWLRESPSPRPERL